MTLPRTRRALALLMAASVLAMLAACSDEGGNETPSEPEEDNEQVERTLVDDAAEQMPTVEALHTQVFKRTCSPDNGVCHNTKEFPDLHTPGNLIDSIGKPCNLSEEPENIFDDCELPGDFLTLDSGPERGFSSRIAHHEIVEDDWIIQLADPVEGCEAHRAAFTVSDGSGSDTVIIEAPNQALFVECDSTEVRVGNIAVLGPQVVAGLANRIKMGDPNRNGVLGAEVKASVQIFPGEPERSYLLARTLGTVPGTRMPLANQPLSDAEMLAFICWIETVGENPAPSDPILYDDCSTAQKVIETGELELPEPVTTE